MEDIGLFEAILTNRAIRRFRPDPVPDAVVRRVIEAAVHGPSGGNRQPWLFVVVRDRGLKEAIAPLYLKSWEESYGERTANRARTDRHVIESADYFARHVADTPVLVFACADHAKVETYVPGQPLTLNRHGASVYPAVQNLLLACRALGLGSALTTLHRRYEDDVKKVLGLPAWVETYAMLPIGYPAEGVKFGVTRRPPVEEFILQAHPVK